MQIRKGQIWEWDGGGDEHWWKKIIDYKPGCWVRYQAVGFVGKKTAVWEYTHYFISDGTWANPRLKLSNLSMTKWNMLYNLYKIRENK
jgi:hypothetical protein